jgi:hypothetical protein
MSRMRGLYLHSPNTPSCCGAQLKQRDSFTFTFTATLHTEHAYLSNVMRHVAGMFSVMDTLVETTCFRSRTRATVVALSCLVLGRLRLHAELIFWISGSVMWMVCCLIAKLSPIEVNTFQHTIRKANFHAPIGILTHSSCVR